MSASVRILSWVVLLGGALSLATSVPVPSEALAKGDKDHPPGRGPSKKRKSPRRSAKEIRSAGGSSKSSRGDAKRSRTGRASGAKTGKPKRWGKCPYDMVTIRGSYCIDRYEAYVAEILPSGKLRRHSVFEPLDPGKRYKALNRRGRMPQAYISRNEAEQACFNAGKRLCTDSEWVTACKGKKPTTWPYGKEREPGRCNDEGVSAFTKYFGADGKEPPQSAYTWENLNDPRLNKPKGTCAPAGRFKKCKNSFHVYDMVGNLHEWTSNPGGTFRGGYYLDVEKHGAGCDYRTTAHNPKYHDYSTGFRCCADL